MKLDLLREYGISTASDLEAAVYGRIKELPNTEGQELDRLLNLHPTESGEWVDDKRPSALGAVLRTLAMERNLQNIRSWKGQQQPQISVRASAGVSARTTNAHEDPAPAPTLLP